MLPAGSPIASEPMGSVAMELPLKDGRFVVVTHGAAMHVYSSDSLTMQKLGVSN